MRQMIDYYYVLGANTDFTENADSSFLTTNQTNKTNGANAIELQKKIRFIRQIRGSYINEWG